MGFSIDLLRRPYNTLALPCECVIGSRQTSCVCFLDLSAAFDTIDHNILLTRLPSRFGIQGTALNWFRSSMSSCCFRVKCNNNLSSLHTCLCDVPQSSVLGPLLFIMHTIPLSTLVSSVSLNHYLYADDTLLFLSFRPLENSTLISLTCKMLYNISLPG